MQLPPELAHLIESLAEGVAARELAAAAAALSASYRRDGGAGGRAMATGHAARVAYLVTRMPATFAAMSAALGRLAEGAPDLAPSSHLDLGSGPGTAAWAVSALFPSVDRLELHEYDDDLAGLGAGLMRGHHALDGRVRWMPTNLARGTPLLGQADLVTVGYVLGELPGDAARRVVASAWEATRMALVIVEPGTPDGFRRLAASRESLLAMGARIVAPCPHAAACPLAGVGDAGRWCHFVERLPRLRRHRHLKGGTIGWEDEPYAYLAVARGDAASATHARVISTPRVHKGAVELEVCRPDGTAGPESVARRSGSYKSASKLGWGDAFGG